jgi:hypothetical protein
MSEPVKICIVMEGGCISAVLTAGVPVEFAVIDYDVEGCGERGSGAPDEQHVKLVPQHRHAPVPGFVDGGRAEDSEFGRMLTMWAHDQFADGS